MKPSFATESWTDPLSGTKYHAGDGIILDGMGEFAGCMIAGFSHQTFSWGEEVWVKLCRPIAWPHLIGTTSTGCTVSAEEFSMQANRLRTLAHHPRKIPYWGRED